LREELLVDREKRVEELNGLEVGGSISALSDEGKVGDGTEKDRSGSDTGGLGLLVLLKLLVEGELEGLVGRVVDLDNVVVGVEAGGQLLALQAEGRGSLQFTHLGGNNIDTLLSVLSTSTHGKVGVKGRELLRLVSLGDNTEVVRVIEEVVVKGEVSAAMVNKRSKRS
jgi:hypothetical protein